MINPSLAKSIAATSSPSVSLASSFRVPPELVREMRERSARLAAMKGTVAWAQMSPEVLRLAREMEERRVGLAAAAKGLQAWAQMPPEVLRMAREMEERRVGLAAAAKGLQAWVALPDLTREIKRALALAPVPPDPLASMSAIAREYLTAERSPILSWRERRSRARWTILRSPKSHEVVGAEEPTSKPDPDFGFRKKRW